MAREKGMFQAAANYEVLKAAPFDARMKVDTKADLTNPDTWTLKSGEIWIYDAMIVAVANDSDEANNGIYMLLDAKNYTNEAAWMQGANGSDIAALKQQIEEIEVGSGADVEVGNFDQLPATGTSGITYFVRKEKTIYRWDAETQSYISYGGGGANLDDIKIIYGGNSNG